MAHLPSGNPCSYLRSGMLMLVSAGLAAFTDLMDESAQSPGAVEEILDRENKRMADTLASKVTRLKSLALDIDRDVEDQNRYLDGMDSDFTSVTGLLTGSVKRFSTMARSGRDNRKLLCGVAMGLIVVFFILSYLLSRART